MQEQAASSASSASERRDAVTALRDGYGKSYNASNRCNEELGVCIAVKLSRLSRKERRVQSVAGKKKPASDTLLLLTLQVQNL